MNNELRQATIRTSEGFEKIAIDQLTESMDIVKIGNKHMKPYVYTREFDFTYLSRENSQIYGLKPKVYKYVKVGTEQYFSSVTTKWINNNISRDNKLGDLLKKVECMLNDNIEPKNLKEYITKRSRMLSYFDTIEQAKGYEKILIDTIQLEEEQWGLDVICLNTKDKPIEVNEQGYKLRL